MIFQKVPGVIFLTVCISFVSGENHVSAIKGKDAVFPCYDVKYSTYEDFYVRMFFGSRENEIAKYKPSISDSPIIASSKYQKRFTLMKNNGSIKISQITVDDEGIWFCQVFAFDSDDPIVTTHLSVYVAPAVSTRKITDPLKAGTGFSDVAECLAIGGKPPAKISWSSSRKFKFEQIESNTTSGVFTDVRAVLQFEPTRFYNNEVFECLVEHPALETVDSFKMITVNVTYPPVKMTMKASKDNKQLSCHAEGNPAVNYKWIMPGSTVPQPGGNTIDMLEADNPDHYNDTYICIVENSVGTNSMNITAYAATSEVKMQSQADVGLIVGCVAGVLLLLAAAAGAVYYFRIRKFRKEDKGPYHHSLVKPSFHSDHRPPIQHANDSLNKNRPPSPSTSPPFADDNELHSSESDDDGQHDVDLEARVVEPPRTQDTPSDTGITSRSSMNFRPYWKPSIRRSTEARRQKPRSSPSARKSRTESQMQEQAPQHPTDHHYSPVPGEYDDDDEGHGYPFHQEDYGGEHYNNDHHPLQQPQYVGYSRNDRQNQSPPTRGYNSSSYEPKYSEIDHSGYRQGVPGKRSPLEEPVEYAQIRAGYAQEV